VRGYAAGGIFSSLEILESILQGERGSALSADILEAAFQRMVVDYPIFPLFMVMIIVIFTLPVLQQQRINYPISFSFLLGVSWAELTSDEVVKFLAAAREKGVASQRIDKMIAGGEIKLESGHTDPEGVQLHSLKAIIASVSDPESAREAFRAASVFEHYLLRPPSANLVANLAFQLTLYRQSDCVMNLLSDWTRKSAEALSEKSAHLDDGFALRDKVLLPFLGALQGCNISKDIPTAKMIFLVARCSIYIYIICIFFTYISNKK
jgi:hypothetical protein